MSNYALRRASDLSDMPRPVAWSVIAIREVGLPAVVIGALLYICFFSMNQMTSAVNKLSEAIVKVDTNSKSVSDNQKIIMDRLMRP